MDLTHWLGRAVEAVESWQDRFAPYDRHPSLHVGDEDFGKAFQRLVERLHGNYPFFHPHYAGQMLKPPHPAAVVGYLAAMLINPNNHALDGGPPTAAMEREVVDRLATMFGYGTHLGHLTSSGTMANLEALFVARELHPGRRIAYSAEAHYTHARMCRVLGVEGQAIQADARGRIDLDALEAALRTGEIGTVVLTTGTTGLGAVDQVHEALELTERYGTRIHVDAAYGGFFTLLAGEDGIDPAPWQAIARADSIVVDPHKHGLQPYGCGAVLFKDPSVGRFYVHDSPYTYFTSDELHLGEISLECSRAGASAAALWLTFELLPPTKEGLGQALRAGRRKARDLAKRMEGDFTLYQQPELDIVTYFPTNTSLKSIDAASGKILARGMAEDVYLSTFQVSAESMAARHPGIELDAPGGRVLRSVVMKPETDVGYVRDWLSRAPASS
ncbi:pyridoxal phosphate-dependent decarboxylase family protein [Nonomuraea sp. NPDC050556]|uniref:pyridoxal phosphate-dependent decarboxylase family protein n=1 Tax=Nonomuraea sp. NPDC050556 TaxID=3364369 RepID=UPI0037AFD061